MWQTNFKLAERHIPVLAKIKPTNWIDGGYEIGYINKDTNRFHIQMSSKRIPLDRVERWIAFDDLERILMDENSVPSMREGILPAGYEINPIDRSKEDVFTYMNVDGRKVLTEINGQPILPQDADLNHSLDTLDQPTLRPMREGILPHDLGGEG